MFMIWLPHSNRWVKTFSFRSSQRYMNELTTEVGEAGQFEATYDINPREFNNIFQIDEPFLKLDIV